MVATHISAKTVDQLKNILKGYIASHQPKRVMGLFKPSTDVTDLQTLLNTLKVAPYDDETVPRIIANFLNKEAKGKSPLDETLLEHKDLFCRLYEIDPTTVNTVQELKHTIIESALQETTSIQQTH